MKKLFFVHGFLGHQEEGLAKALKDFFIQKNIIFDTFDFPNHKEKKGKLLNLEEMLVYTYNEFKKLKSLENYLIVGHSQGAAIITRLLHDYNLTNYTILIAPSFQIAQLPERRLQTSEINELKQGKTITKDFGANRHFEIDINFINAYKKFLPLNFANKIQNQTIIIQGGKDEIVGPENILSYHNYYDNVSHIIVENGNHVFADNESLEKVFNTIEKRCKQI